MQMKLVQNSNSVLCGSICGAESWRDFVLFGKVFCDNYLLFLSLDVIFYYCFSVLICLEYLSSHNIGVVLRNDKIILTLCMFFLVLLFANSYIPAPLANFHAANLRFIGNH